MTDTGLSTPSRNRRAARASSGKAAPGFSQGDIEGRYAYHFSGNTMLLNIRYSLLGVGWLQIAKSGKAIGQQRASITPLQGQCAELRTAYYALVGQVTLHSDGTGEAVIRFTKTAGNGVDVNGNFFVQVAGTADRLWFISSGSTLPRSGNAPADEQVTVEAVRIPGS
jgi:hypothetical protein